MPTKPCQASAKRHRLALVILLVTGSGCATSKPKIVSARSVNPSVIVRGSQAASTASQAAPYQLAGWQGKSQADNRNDESETVGESPKDFSNSEAMSSDEVVAEPYTNATSLSVESCVLIAVQSHPKVAAARARVVAAQNRIPQARALADPMLNNNFFPIASNAQQTASGRMQNSISIIQAVPWPEKLKAREAVAAREVCIAQAEVDTIEREIAEMVRLSYYEIWLAQRGLTIVLKNQKLVDDLIRVAEARYKSGGSQQDVLNAEIERERLVRQQFEIEGQSSAAQADLAALLQQPQSLSITTDAALPFDNLPTRLDELVALAEQCNPELRGLGFEIQRDLQKRRLANLQRYSDFQIGAGYDFMTTRQAISPVADGVDNISFGVGMTLPVWRERIRAGVAESAAQVASSSRLRDAEKLSIVGRLRRLLAEIDSLDQQRTVYTERIIPRAEQAVNIATSEYTVSKTSFVQLTDNYRELLSFQFQIIQIEARLASRLAQLERTVGCRDPQFIRQ